MDLTKQYIKETGRKPLLIEHDNNLGFTFEYTVWLQDKLEKLLTIHNVINFWRHKKDGKGLRFFLINIKDQSGKASAMQPPIVY